MTAAWIGRRRVTSVLVAAGVALAACGDAADDADIPPPGDIPASSNITVAPVTFDTVTLILHSDSRTVPMLVEVAERPDQRAYGLMDRDELDPESGMVFLYDAMQHRDSGFWMYRTRIPLDIAFFDGSGRIRAIRQMMPCTSFDAAQCPGYSAGVDYFGAVEANRGFFARHNIGVGDRVVVPGRIGE